MAYAMVPRFKRFATRAILALVAVLPCAAHAAPPRVVSINMCADQLLLALADPEQILALSALAADPAMSFMAKQAEAFRHDVTEAEQVVQLTPDVVFAGRYTKRATREMLQRLGYRVELLDAARSIDESIDQIRHVAGVLQRPERGEVLIAEIEAARQRAMVMDDHARPTAAVYQRRGYVSGGNTLTSELLKIAGFDDGAEHLAGDRGGFVPLERMIAEPPDFIVVSSTGRKAEDQGSALLAHPALAEIFPPERRIELPDYLTSCGGPSLPAALDLLSALAASVR